MRKDDDILRGASDSSALSCDCPVSKDSYKHVLKSQEQDSLKMQLNRSTDVPTSVE